MENWDDYCPSDQYKNEKIIACNQQVCGALKVVRSSQQTVHQEVFALAVITLKNAILGVFRLEMLSIVLHVILDITVTKLDSSNRLFLSSTLGRQYCLF